MTPSEDEFVLAAARVARTAPESWMKLLDAVSKYASLQATNCIQSPLEELPRAQGRAQMAAKIRDLMVDCLASADKIESKRK